MADQGQVATYTLDQAFSAIGFGKYQFLLLAFAGLGSIAEAMEMMLLSFIGLGIQSEMNLTSTQVNFISVVTYAGLLLGSYLWGIISDRYGRKIGIMGASIVAVVSGLVSTGTFSYTWLLFLRVIFGLGLGGGHIFNSWFMEFVPTPNQGSWMVVFSAFYTAGTIVQALLLLLIMPNYNWRWLLGAAIAPHFVVLCFILCMPESPRFLCAQGRLSDAEIVFENGAILNQKTLPKFTLVYDQINSTAGTDQPVRTPGPLEHVAGISSPPRTHEASGDSTLTTLITRISSPPRTHEASGDSTLTTPLITRISSPPRTHEASGDSTLTTPPITRISSPPRTHEASGDSTLTTPPITRISSPPRTHEASDSLSDDLKETGSVSDGSPQRTPSSYDNSGNLATKDLVTDDISGNSAQTPPDTDDISGNSAQTPDFLGHSAQRARDSVDIPTHSSEITHASTEIPDDENDDEPKKSSSSVGSGSHSKTSILSPRWRSTTLLIWLLYFFNTFNYYEFVLLTSQSSTGSLLTSEAFKISWPLLNVLITSVAEIPGLMIAAIMLNKFGRKFSIEILLGAGFIVIFPMMFFQSKALTGVFMFLARMFLSSSFVLVQIYSTEAFPTKLRATGVGVAMALGYIGGTVWPIVSSVIRGSSHNALPFLLYEAKILVSGLCVWFLPVGTTEKKLVLPVKRSPLPD